MKIKRFFYNFFLCFFKSRRITYFDLLEEYEDYVRGQDVSVRNTLVGTVKSKEQYDVNLKYNFYHIPSDLVDDADAVEYVALYRSKSIFEKDSPGIQHYGRVVKREKVKRRDIKELMLNFSPDRDYYRFEVSAWETLNSPVKAREIAPRVSCMTNDYLLNNSLYVYELYLNTNDELKLFLGLSDLLCEVYDGFFVNESRVYLNLSRIILLTPNGKFSFPIRDYKRYPFETFRKIKSLLLS